MAILIDALDSIKNRANLSSDPVARSCYSEGCKMRAGAKLAWFAVVLLFVLCFVAGLAFGLPDPSPTAFEIKPSTFMETASKADFSVFIDTESTLGPMIQMKFYLPPPWSAARKFKFPFWHASADFIFPFKECTVRQGTPNPFTAQRASEILAWSLNNGYECGDDWEAWFAIHGPRRARK